MNSLIQYKKEFDSRHDWDIEEENILKNNWPSIKFENIPQAWIIPIDKALLSLSDIESIKEIKQYYGQIIVSPHDKKFEKIVERLVKVTDIDLNE